MPNNKSTLRKNSAELASSPAATATPPALGALRNLQDDGVRRTKSQPPRPLDLDDEDENAEFDIDDIRVMQADGLSTGDRYQEIAARAYEIYLARGEGEGDALSDWLEAERQVTARDRS